jgi:hypothetical protein
MPALCGLTGGHDHGCMLLSEAASFGMVPIGVLSQRVTRVVGVVLIPKLIACRKLVMRLFCGGKNESTTTKSAWYGGAGFVFLPTALAVLNSCYLIKLSSLCLGTVLTLLRWRSIANR